MRLTPQNYAAVAARATLIVPPEGVEEALDRMAAAITADLADLDPLVLCIMSGAVIAAGRLLPRLGFQLQMDYLHATRYGGTTRGGDLQWLHRPRAAIQGRHVLLLDDILDEGLTLEAATRACREDGATSVRAAVLVEKERSRACDFQADYVGVRTPDLYLFGCGLDYLDYFRNAPGIFAVAAQDV